MDEIYQRPDKAHFWESPELNCQMQKDMLVHKYVSKQEDLDKILKIIQRKS